MFAQLGIAGACSLLGGLSMLMCIIPFVFLWQGEKIRANSKFCTALRARKEEMTRKIEEQKERRRRTVLEGEKEKGKGDTTTSSSSPSPASGSDNGVAEEV
jgi:hypothetical protein